MEQEGMTINVSVKRLNEQQSQVSELIRRIVEECALTGSEGIRLIFRGRCLRPEQRLSDCGVGEGSVLHMVSRPPPSTVVPPQAPSDGTETQGTNEEPASSSTNAHTFRSFPIGNPGGLMMGSMHIEADPSDPNMMQNVLQAIQQAIQQAHGAAASAGAGGILMGPFSFSSNSANPNTMTSTSTASTTTTTTARSTGGVNIAPMSTTTPSAPLLRSAGLRGQRQTQELLDTINADLQGLIDQMSSVHESVESLSTGMAHSPRESAMALQFHQMLGLLQTLFASLISYSARIGSRVYTGEPLNVGGMAEMNMFVIGLRRLRLLLFSLISVCEGVSVNTLQNRLIPPASVYLSGAVQGPMQNPPAAPEREAAPSNLSLAARLVQTHQEVPVASLLRAYQPAAEAFEGITFGQIVNGLFMEDHSAARAIQSALARFVDSQMGSSQEDRISVATNQLLQPFTLAIDACEESLIVLYQRVLAELRLFISGILTDAYLSMEAPILMRLGSFFESLNQLGASSSAAATTNQPQSSFSRVIGLFLGVLMNLLRPALGILAESLIGLHNENLPPPPPNPAPNLNRDPDDFPPTRKRPFAQ